MGKPSARERQGLDSFLELKPDVVIIELVHQHHKHEMFEDYRAKNPEAAQVFMPEPDGPWTTLTVLEDGEYKAYAIWNRTGNVYKMNEDGSVEDDPFIEVTLLGGTSAKEG